MAHRDPSDRDLWSQRTPGGSRPGQENPSTPPNRQTPRAENPSGPWATEKVDDSVHEVEESAKQVAHAAGEQAKSTLGVQKQTLTTSLTDLARALHSSSRELREDEHSTMAGLIDQAADQVQSLSGALRDNSIDEMVYGAERYARRHPEIVIGGAMALGLLGARFLKSSGQRARQVDTQSTTDAGRQQQISTGRVYHSTTPHGSTY